MEGTIIIIIILCVAISILGFILWKKNQDYRKSIMLTPEEREKLNTTRKNAYFNESLYQEKIIGQSLAKQDYGDNTR